MPIIEYLNTTKTYKVYVCTIVEWQTLVCSVKNPNAPYSPFMGYDMDSNLCGKLVLETADQKEAFTKMAELWAAWKDANFTGVQHA